MGIGGVGEVVAGKWRQLYSNKNKKIKINKNNISVWLPLSRPLLGTWPATQVCSVDWELNQ